MEAYHRTAADQGPMILEKVSDLDSARDLLGDFTDIRGKIVVNPTGDHVGRVDDLYMDPKQGKIAMADISFGGTWGFGARRVLVPIDQIELVGDGTVRVISTPEIVKGAPAFPELEGSDFARYQQYWRDTMQRKEEEH